MAKPSQAGTPTSIREARNHLCFFLGQSPSLTESETFEAEPRFVRTVRRAAPKFFAGYRPDWVPAVVPARVARRRGDDAHQLGH